MIEPKKLNGELILYHKSTRPQAETSVDTDEVETDMSRKAPMDPTVGEYRSDMLRATLATENAAKAMETAAKVMEAAVLSMTTRKVGWGSPQGIGTLLIGATLIVGMILGYGHLTDRVSALESQTATVNRMEDTLTRMDERQKTENLAARVVSLEKANMFEYGANEQKRTGGRK